MMRKVLRAAVVTAVLVPAAIASVGAASADGYGQHTAAAGPNGAISSHVMSGTTANGGTYYIERNSMAGPDGAMSSSTHSVADGSMSNRMGGGLLGLGWLLG
ncbi:hypothetical protein [Streptomyces marianii]|nr:hypothetical protein [Streptomyces marianii]